MCFGFEVVVWVFECLGGVFVWFWVRDLSDVWIKVLICCVFWFCCLGLCGGFGIVLLRCLVFSWVGFVFVFGGLGD